MGTTTVATTNSAPVVDDSPVQSVGIERELLPGIRFNLEVNGSSPMGKEVLSFANTIHRAWRWCESVSAELKGRRV